MPERDFESIYANYSRLVYWAAYGVVSNKEQAEDATQNAFISVLKNMELVNSLGDSQLKGWLYRVSVNAALDILRRNKRETPSDDPVGRDIADTAMLPEDVAVQNDTNSALRAALEGLDDIYRKPLLLHYFSGMSIKDISNALDISEGTIKSRMARGRAMLATILRANGIKL